MNTQNTSQAKFLIKELLAVLKIMQKEEYDNEVDYLVSDLRSKLMDNIEWRFRDKEEL